MCFGDEKIRAFAKQYDLEIMTKNNVEILYFETDFEIIMLKINRPYLLHANNMIRFVEEDSIGELDKDKNLSSIGEQYFYPSHKEHQVIGGESDDTQEYIGEEVVNDSLVLYRHRHDCSTSFFKVYYMEEKEIMKAILDLKKEIYTLRNTLCSLGYLQSGYGIIEETNKEKTENPTTKHCSFWKISSRKNPEATFLNISKKFHLI